MKKHYTRKYFEKRSTFPKHLAEQIAFILKSKKVFKVLDVGSGTGLLVEFLNNAGFETTGCDISAEAVKISGHTKASATNLPFQKNTFDAVTAVSLIEHLSLHDVNKFFLEAGRVLKSGGIIFLVTPNFASPWRMFLGKRWFGYQDPSHKTFFTPFSLAKLAKSQGFKNISFIFPLAPNLSFDWPIPKSWQKTPKLFQKIVNFVIISTPLTLLRDSFWIIGVKNEEDKITNCA